MGGVTAAATAAPKHNWMREYVQLREQAVLERAVGAERAAAIRAATPRIVGGTRAQKNANPFQVGLLFKMQPDNFFAQYCGGSLYKPNVVVTAAHCSDFVAAGDVQVLTGTRKLDGSGTRRNVLEIIVHPDFDPVTLDSDIAVWILESNATGIETVKLTGRSDEPGAGVNSLATGWGNTDTSNPNFPIALRQVFVPLVSRKDCNDADSYDGQITKTMICAGLEKGGKDTCQGDSGGPLTTSKAWEPGIGHYDFLTGITSWGTGCAEPELFGVYTRVSVFKDWIEDQLP
jgi:secreted trypsin-like serine protease